MILSSEELNLVTGGGVFKSCFLSKNKSYNFPLRETRPNWNIGNNLITLKFKNRRWKVISVK